MSSSQPLLNNKEFDYPEQNPNFKGVPLDPQLLNGPLEYRRYRDVFFTIIYVLFWILMIAVAIFAFVNGNPTLLATPFDPDGRQCGHNTSRGNAKGYEYLYFTDPSKDNQKFACVKKCPENFGDQVDILPNSQVQETTMSSQYTTLQIVKVCNPSDSLLSASISSLISIGSVSEWASDLQRTWPIMLAVSGIALTLSFIMIILLKYCAGCIVWSCIALYFGSITALGGLLVYDAVSEEDTESKASKDSTLALGISLLILSFFSFIVFMCIYRKLKIAVGVLKASSQFVQEVPTIMTVPLALFIKTFLFFIFWVAVCIFIYSCGTIKSNPNMDQPFGQIEWMTGVKRSFGTYLVGLMWNIDLILSIGQFVIGSATAMWYFNHLPNFNMHNPVTQSFSRAYTYQFGSLCFGSLILTIVKLLVLLMETIDRNMKNAAENDPSGQAKAARCLTKCGLCCVKCFERFIRFLSERAFIMMALEGKSFCNSAYDGYYLIMRNKLTFTVVSQIGQIMVFFTMLFICVISTFMGYGIITSVDSYSSMIYEPAIPTLFFFLISYTIAYVCMQVYGMSSDALLMCLVADQELGKGKGRGVPPVLQMFIDEYL